MDSQGAMANYSGSAFETDVRHLLASQGYKLEKYKYKALWYNKCLNSPDIYVPELDLVVECKNQESQGTADQKGCTELFNAGQRIQAKNYVLLYGGSWWDDGRGKQLYHAYKDFANLMRKNKKDFLLNVENVEVMRMSEFKYWLKEKYNNGQ